MTSRMAAVPSTIDDVTPQWLSAVFDGGAVTDVRVERIAEDTGFSALLYRLHLVGEDVPSSVIVKLPAQSEARGAMELLGGYQRELSFYRHVAGAAPMQTPRVYAARMMDGSADFEGAAKLVANVRRLGEPWKFGLHPDETPSFLRRFGIELIEDFGANDYRKRYLGDCGDDLRGYAFYRVAVGKVTAPLSEADGATSLLHSAAAHSPWRSTAPATIAAIFSSAIST